MMKMQGNTTEIDERNLLRLDALLSHGYGLSPQLVMRSKGLSIEAKALYSYLKYPVEQHPNYIYLDPGRNKPGQVKNRCLYDEPFNILEYMDEIRTKDDTYAS